MFWIILMTGWLKEETPLEKLLSDLILASEAYTTNRNSWILCRAKMPLLRYHFWSSGPQRAITWAPWWTPTLYYLRIFHLVYNIFLKNLLEEYIEIKTYFVFQYSMFLSSRNWDWFCKLSTSLGFLVIAEQPRMGLSFIFPLSVLSQRAASSTDHPEEKP